MIYGNRQRYIVRAIEKNIGPTREALWIGPDPDHARPPILFVGNGVSRLIASPPGWDGLFRDLWMDPATKWTGANVRLDYDLASRRMNNAERASYLLNNLPAESKKKVLETLHEKTEIDPSPKSDLADIILSRFDVIITTNFDNLLERQALAHGIAFDRIVLSPSAKSFTVEHYPASSTAPASEETEPGRARLLIVKVHGSFPFERRAATKGDFTRWWDNVYQASEFTEELVLTFAAYQGRMKVHAELYDALAKEIAERQRLGGDQATALTLGYGLAFDDMSISALLTRVSAGARGVIEFGADTIYRHRAHNQWGIERGAAILVPDYYGAGAEYRKWAYEYVLRKLVGAPLTGVVTGQKSPRSALVLGQSSVNYVTRLEAMPQAERSYKLRKGQDKLPGKARLTGPLWYDPSIAQGEAIQVGGQMFVPAAMLDALGHPVHLISVLSDDEHGDRVKSYLKWHTQNLDWSLVCSTEPWHPTEHAYVMSVLGVRTILDYDLGTLDKARLRIEASPDHSAHRVKVQGLRKEIVTKFNPNTPSKLYSTNLGVVYLSKWFARELIDSLVAIKTGRQIFVYETGSVGSQELGRQTSDAKAPVPVEVAVSAHIDVVLASSLFAMRMAHFNLRSVLGVTSGIPTTVASVSEFDAHWKSLADGFALFMTAHANPSRSRLEVEIDAENFADELGAALQMRAFLHLVDYLGPRKLADLLFDNAAGLFPNMQHLCVSLGGEGAMLFHREIRDRILWVVGEKLPEISTLGCGDVARSGYLSAYLDAVEDGGKPLSSDQFHLKGEAATLLQRFGVMGSFKTRFLNVEAAFAAIGARMRAMGDLDLDESEKRQRLIDDLSRKSALNIELLELTEDRGPAYAVLRKRVANVDTVMRNIFQELDKAPPGRP